MNRFDLLCQLNRILVWQEQQLWSRYFLLQRRCGSSSSKNAHIGLIIVVVTVAQGSTEQTALIIHQMREDSTKQLNAFLALVGKILESEK